MSGERIPSAPFITAERWTVLSPHVDAALQLAAEGRQSYLDAVCRDDAALGAELERVVGACTGDEALLHCTAAERLALLLEKGTVSRDGAELRSQLQASLGAAYTLEREIRGGGMSRVFVAVEHALDRTVVIKVLAPELAEGISAERFEREIKLAASLQQANIVPLLAAGSAAGYPYYTMPLVDGRSLHERLARDGALTILQGVSLLRDVARALAYAHEHGVVHRDIKPGNVLLSGGTAVVTDFGIAKALGAARHHGASATLTQAGMGIGTPAYMAPEQAAGDPDVDHRADLYSFGCLAYEVFTGQSPFHGQATHRMIAAHFRETARPVTELRADVPDGVAGLIAQCLEKDPARRPQSAAELLVALDSHTSQPALRPRPRPRAVVATAVVVAVALLASAVYLVTRAGGGAAPQQPITFAAVPFTNVSGDTALEFRASGMSDEILTAMGRVPGVLVTGRSAAYRFKGKHDVDARTIERALGTRLVVMGTIEQRGGKLIVSAQLSDSMTGGEIWSARYERATTEFGVVSSEIAGTITQTLRSRLGLAMVERPDASNGAGTSNSAALDFYLVGQEFLKHRRIKESLASFESAIGLDPRFARAYAAQATALQYVPFFLGTPPSELWDRTTIAARRALELDSTLADAHTALGSVYLTQGEWARAEREFRLAVALEPGNFTAHHTYGRLLLMRGAIADAIAQFEEARAVERISPLVSAWVAYGYFMQGRDSAALGESARAVQLDSTLTVAMNMTAIINLATGHPDVARRVIEVLPPVGAMSMAPYVYARLGDTATAWSLVRRLESNIPRPWFTDATRATVLLARADTTGALDALARSDAVTGGAWVLVTPLGDPMYDPLRRSPRFADLVRRAGLNPALFTGPHGGRTH